jgi:hypothetical protein
MAEVFGHLRVQRRFRHLLREPGQQPARLGQRDALLARLGDQLLRQPFRHRQRLSACRTTGDIIGHGVSLRAHA